MLGFWPLSEPLHKKSVYLSAFKVKQVRKGCPGLGCPFFKGVEKQKPLCWFKGFFLCGRSSKYSHNKDIFQKPHLLGDSQKSLKIFLAQTILSA